MGHHEQLPVDRADQEHHARGGGPGIAEALLATALGLVAAIPAVVAYNKLSGDLDRYANRVHSFADEFTVVLSRELDGGRLSGLESSRAA